MDPSSLRIRVTGALRVLVALPLFLGGLGMIGARALVIGVLVGLTLAGFVLNGWLWTLFRIDWWVTTLWVLGLAVLAVGLWTTTTIRELARTEPAAMIGGTRPPRLEGPEEPVVETVRRLAKGIDRPVPSIRVADTRRPLSFTLRYPGSRSPTETVDDSPLYDRSDGPQFDRLAYPANHDEADVPSPSDADHVLVVSTGLIETLEADELEGVLAHELAHVANGDLRIFTWLLMPVSYGFRLLDFGFAEDSDDMHWTTYLDWREWMLFVLLDAPYGIGVLLFAVPAVVMVGRGREFAADRGSAVLTGDPAALATALERMDAVDGAGEVDERTARPNRDLRAVAVANVVPSGRLGDLTHPATASRVRRLRRLVRRLETGNG